MMRAADSARHEYAPSMHSDGDRRITHRTLLKVLAGGFTIVMILLAVGASVAVHNSREIQKQAGELVREQALTARLITQMRLEQATLNAVFYQLTNDPEQIDRGDLARQLDSATESLSRLVVNAAATPEAQLWQQLEQSAQMFSSEARQLIAASKPTEADIRSLFRRHDKVMSEVRVLANASSSRARAVETRITVEAGRQMQESLALLLGSLVFALICAVLTVRLATSLFRRMELQANELSRVSWHMVQGQEEAARRFSHELHDELGQSLTALKATTASLTHSNLDVQRTDCLGLIDESIRNVRELSQLLRPVILDDFGLDAGLRWLSEKFAQRSGIQADYTSDFHGRLDDGIETHLFRIAQEAFTNVARHSGATRVQIRLSRREDRIWLSVADNGRGIRSSDDHRRTSIGMTGMRARARDAGGEFVVHSSEGAGVHLEVWMPVASPKEHATEESPDPVGR